MLKKAFCFCLTFSLILCAFFYVSAHPGSLDSKGGHWNRSTGTYHFHTGENTSSSSSGSSSFTYEPFVAPYEPPIINPYTIEHITQKAFDTESDFTTADSRIIVSLFLAIAYIIVMIIKMYKDIRNQSLSSKYFSYPFVSWYIAYFVVFSSVFFCSVIGYSKTFSAQLTIEYTTENLKFSALIAMLSTIGIVIAVFIFLFLSDKIEDKKISKKGCYITKTSTDTLQKTPNHQSSEADEHPFRPLLYLYSFYIFSIFYAVSFTEYNISEKVKVFVTLALLCSAGYVLLLIALAIVMIIISPLIAKCMDIKSVQKELVCNNCGSHNDVSSYVCSKCGIDFVYYDKSINTKNMLDVCMISNIHSINPEYCSKIIHSDTYSFYSYNVWNYSDGCLLRQNNLNRQIVYFGKYYDFNCVYEGYLFSVNKNSDVRKDHRVIAKHIVSGKEETYFWFSPGTIWDNGTYCQDSVKQMYVREDKLIIEVHRRKSTDFPDEYKRYLKSKYNTDTIYIITVIYEDGKFSMSKTFPELTNDLFVFAEAEPSE